MWLEVGGGGPALPALSEEEDEEFEQGLTRADILLLLFFSQLRQQGESSVPASQVRALARVSFQVN